MRNRTYTLPDGSTWTLDELCRKTGVAPNTMRRRLRRFTTMDKILMTKAQANRSTGWHGQPLYNLSNRSR